MLSNLPTLFSYVIRGRWGGEGGVLTGTDVFDGLGIRYEIPRILSRNVLIALKRYNFIKKVMKTK